MINQKIRNAGFVSVEPTQEERFKYYKNFFKNIGSTESFQQIKRRFNILFGKIRNWIGLYDWKTIKNDFAGYIIEASIEGTAINFGLHFVFGLPFTIWTTLGYGVLTKEIVSFWWRLKKDGSDTKIPKKDK